MIETRIYVADTGVLADEQLYSYYYNLVPEYRREMADRYRRSVDRCNSIGVAALLIMALKEQGLDAGEFSMDILEGGKPVLRDMPQIHFNLSHAGERAMCIVSGYNAGCDIERTDRGRQGIADRCLMPEELELLANCDNEVQWNREFTRLWTLKESYIKLTGRGLSQDMRGFSAMSLPDGVDSHSYELEDDYICSFCVDGRLTAVPMVRRITL